MDSPSKNGRQIGDEPFFGVEAQDTHPVKLF